MAGYYKPATDKNGHVLHALRKSYKDPSKSFTSPDYSERSTWFHDYTRVTDELLSTQDDIIYSSDRVPTSGWDHSWLRWSEIPNHARQSDPANLTVIVKKNDVVITSGFTIDYKNGKVTFATANAPADTIKVTYSYANSSKFDLTAIPGKKLHLDYVEIQFTEGCTLPEGEALLFQSIYNGPAMPPNALGAGHPGWPADTDIVLKTFEYWGYRDFLNESTQAMTCLPFMGMTKNVVILPWNYLTGHTILPVGSNVDLLNGEFHKLRCCVKNDGIVGSAEIATGTFYCLVMDL